jgi:uncharacterized protein
MIPSINEFDGMTVTINTTEDCNLRCKYCYEINKKSRDIELDKVYKFIDIILTDPDPTGESTNTKRKRRLRDGVVLDFIGGDALMNIDIVDKALSYAIFRLNELDHKWKNKWAASISTNGTLFGDPKVREFCEKWKTVLRIGVSIDGCPEIHDKYRVYPDGVTGTMSTILEWWPWYKKTFPIGSQCTKATCSKDSIPYLYDSLVFMHEKLGINWVHQNFIMEDTGCTDEDYELLDKQLEKCVGYVLEHRDELYWSVIDKDNFGNAHKPKEDELDETRCGSGCMPCLSIDGKIYPCFRWLPHTQAGDHQYDMSVGDIDKGLVDKGNFIKVQQASRGAISDEECLNCEYESACAYCIAGCYAELGEFKRLKYICRITKLQVKWAKEYWRRYNEFLKD